MPTSVLTWCTVYIWMSCQGSDCSVSDNEWSKHLLQSVSSGRVTVLQRHKVNAPHSPATWHPYARGPPGRASLALDGWPLEPPPLPLPTFSLWSTVMLLEFFTRKSNPGILESLYNFSWSGIHTRSYVSYRFYCAVFFMSKSCLVTRMGGSSPAW